MAHLAALDVPILQGLCLTSAARSGRPTTTGCRPLDVATQVAIPEFDGRIITVPFSFKEIDDDGLIPLRRRPRALRPGRRDRGAHARLRHDSGRRANGVALMLSAYPTKHARIGNAVGLDTPASAVALLRGDARRRLRGSATIPGVDAEDGDALIHALIARGGQDPDWLTDGQLAGNPIRVPRQGLPRLVRHAARRADRRDGRALGPAAGRAVRRPQPRPRRRDRLAALQAGNVVLMVQPPRGFGENPVAIYHDPDLPPSHHYLAAYRWLDATELRRRRGRAPRQARQPGVAARQDAGHVGGLRHRRRARRPAADLPVPGQRPRRGHAGQAPGARHAGRPPDPADGPRRDLRRHRPAGAAARRARQHRGARPRQAARRSGSRSGR